MLKTLNLLFGLIIIPISLMAQNNCLTCHQSWEEETGPSFKFAGDIHGQKGLTCTDCHGGDPNLDDMDEVRRSKNYIGLPDHLEVPEFCARCHSDATYMHNHNPSLPVDQLAKYKTSVHGQRLYEKKDKKAANCISCHTVHEIGDGRLPHSSTYPLNLPATCGRCHADVEYMAEYKIPTDQLEKFSRSVHGQALLAKGDLGAPACNDCHGNHGAAPPGVNSLAAVCGVCHALEAELFAASPHAEAYRENDFPMCETCHSNHYIIKPFDNMIGPSETSICTECHSVDDGTKGLAVADSIRTSLINLVHARTEASNMLDKAISKGIMTTDEEFLLKEVEQSLIQARTMIHSFDMNLVAPKAAAGIIQADTVRTNSAALIDEYYFRRKGLAAATLIITFLAIMLYRKIRQIEKK
jgi:predicted CXXCH cytochrome family protein